MNLHDVIAAKQPTDAYGVGNKEMYSVVQVNV